MPHQRRLEPTFLSEILSFVGPDEVVHHHQMVKQLLEKFKTNEDTVDKMLKLAVMEGFLIFETKRKRKNPSSSGNLIKVYRLPKGEEIKTLAFDPYCFECNGPNNVKKCKKCKRSFHSSCYREFPEKPLYNPPSGKNQKRQNPVYNWEYEDFFEIFSNPRSASSVTEEVPSTASPLEDRELDENEDAGDDEEEGDAYIDVDGDGEGDNEDVDNEENEDDSINERKPLVEDIKPSPNGAEEEKADVMYVGVVREASRHNATSVKNEIYSSSDQEESDFDLCTCCRLLVDAKLRNPPNRTAKELAYLMKFTYQTNHSWLSMDVPTYFESLKIEPNRAKEISKIILLQPVKALNDIKMKLEKNKYTYLIQFLVDILDLQHTIGVFFGTKSPEFGQTKWLVRDIQHDIAEIRRCPDCFRYSNEKICDFWFALPCIQRHELVYAKQIGFSFWPAKVIRVLPNGKYDVRFFGGDHSRALLDPRYIKPLDTPIKYLKMGKSMALKKALEELKFHNDLKARFTPDQFSFKSNPDSVKQIVQNLYEENHFGNNFDNIIQGQGIFAQINGTAYDNANGYANPNGFGEVSNSTPIVPSRRRRASTGTVFSPQQTPMPTPIFILPPLHPLSLQARKRTHNSSGEMQNFDGPSTSAAAAALASNLSGTPTSSTGSTATTTPKAPRVRRSMRNIVDELNNVRNALNTANATIASMEHRLIRRDRTVVNLRDKIKCLERVIIENKRKQWEKKKIFKVSTKKTKKTEKKFEKKISKSSLIKNNKRNLKTKH